MKSTPLFFLFFCLVTTGLWAQVPHKFNFQAVARDASGLPYVSENLSVRASLVRGGVSGMVDYAERHEITTSALGVFRLEIGAGVPLSGTMSTIDWSAAPYYLKVDIDPNGGSDYLHLGTSQLLSVPYAIYSGESGNGGGNPTDELQSLLYDPATQTLTLTDGNSVSLSVPENTDNQTLNLNGTMLLIENGNALDLSSLQDGVQDADPDPTNEIQDLQLIGTTLSIHGGNEVDLGTLQDGTEDADADPTNELQTLTFNAGTNELTITNGNSITIPSGGTDADADPSNELQSLQFSGTLLSIEGGNEVDLASLQDGTEDADSDPTNEIETWETLAGIPAELADGDDVDDADADPTNELQTLTFNAGTNELTITNGNSITIPSGGTDADADPSNELQSLQFSGTLLSIEGGNEVDLASLQDGTEDADSDPTNELQTLTFNAGTNELTITNGNSITIPSGGTDADADPTNELQSLQFSGTLLSIDDGNAVDLASLQDGTEDADSDPTNEIETWATLAGIPAELADGDDVDDADADPTNELQTLTFNAGTNELTITNGNSITIPSGGTDADADPSNELQSLQFSGTLLSIEGGNEVDLASLQDGTEDADSDPTNEIETWATLAGIPAELADGDDVDDADADPTNELQSLQFSGTLLSIDDGNAVDLASLQDGTEDADSDPTNEIETWATLAGIPAELADGDDVDDADADPTNELQSLQFSGTLLSIDDGNAVDLAPLQDGTEDADSDPTNELQSLFFDQNTNELSISGNNTIILPLPADDNDGDPTNEFQTLSLNESTLLLSNGGGAVDLSGLAGSSLWQQAGDNDLYTQEDVAIGFAASQLSTLEVKEDLTIRNASQHPTVDLFTGSTGGHAYLYRGNASGGANGLMVNIDAAAEGGLINLRNLSGSIRSQWSVEDDVNQLEILRPNGQEGIDLSVFATSSALSMKAPNGNNAVRFGASNVGGFATYYGIDGEQAVYIGRNSANPAGGKVSIGDSFDSDILELYVTSDGEPVIDGNGLLGGFTISMEDGDPLIGLSRGFPVTQRTRITSGTVELRSPGGILSSSVRNVYLGNHANSSSEGVVTVHGVTGAMRAGMYAVDGDSDTPSTGVVFADVKNFRMDHPEDASREIWYACVEGPEAAAYERGTARLVNGEAQVRFSEHFALVANHESMTVMLTPLSADCKGLAVVEKLESGFVVKELFQGTGTYHFDWEVKCVRRGFEDYEVVREKR